MPQVPAYSLPQEQERALPSARQESIASPALLDAGAEKTILAGNALLGAGAAGNAVLMHMQQRDNVDALNATEAKDKEAWIAYEADLKSTKTGENAKQATANAAAWWKDRISKNIETMGNTELQRTYSQRATDFQLQTLHGVSTFEVEQTNAAQLANYKANVKGFQNVAAANPTDLAVANSIDQIRTINATQAALRGWPQKVLDDANEVDITEMHKQVIQTLAAKNKDKAAAYYDAHEQEIAGSQRAELGEYAKKATAAALGSQAAQATWTSLGPKGDNEAANIDVMSAAIRDQFKNDTYTRDAALTELKQMFAERNEGIRSRDAQRTATVNEMLMGGQSLAAVQQTPAWLALDGTEQRKILLHEESIAQVREGRAAARESRAFTASQRAEHELNIKGWDTMERLSDPTQLMAIKDRNDLINLRTTIGTENTQRLLAKWDTFSQNTAKLSEAKLDNNQFEQFAADAGLEPKASYAKNKEMAMRVSGLRDKIENVIGQEQIAKRRDLTREEKDAIMRREIDNQVIVHSRIWFDSSTPAMALPSDKGTLAKAYVVATAPDGTKKEVYLSTIPAADRVAITRARRNAGLPVTEQAIAEMWLKKNASAKPRVGASDTWGQ